MDNKAGQHGEDNPFFINWYALLKQKTKVCYVFPAVASMA